MASWIRSLYRQIDAISWISLEATRERGPIYAFEYLWQAKDKRATVEVDGLTSEFKSTGKAFGSQLKRVLNRDMLFDIGTETMNLLVPGAGIALKVTKAVADHRGKAS
jgi:hypothetical protein